MKKYIFFLLSLYINIDASQSQSKRRKHTYGSWFASIPKDQFIYGHIPNAIIELINQEHRSIKLAMHIFTNQDILNALIDAHKRGVKINVLLDGDQICQTLEMYKIYKQLLEGDIEVRPIFLAKGSMHHKFLILEWNGKGCNVVVNGSYNYMQPAGEEHAEDVTILYNSALYKRFSTLYSQLMDASDPDPIHISEIQCPKCKEKVLQENAEYKLILCPNC